MSDTRLLDRADLRRYLGALPWCEIERRMAAGQLPKPLWGVSPNEKTARWDRAAIDSALNRYSHPKGSFQSDLADLDHACGIIR